ncbi:hypothetical protein NP493_453g01011 [Ridgeia piscesae]|uniref:Uncharacterized protein n=1 Tax=Ridgeia piscesae TaxID=27915 RepID=A0AAD9KZ20_RIDPI|nr:hypothetical protein NP493_453g01011 [Ridgeia piscesae]
MVGDREGRAMVGDREGWAMVGDREVFGYGLSPLSCFLLKALEPDPILKLRRIVGFGGCTTSDLLWTSSGTMIVYPCHAVIVAMEASNGHQRFFVGHTDKTGCQSVVRVWKVQSTECLAMFKTHVHSLFSLSFSHSGTVLCEMCC